MLEKSYIGFGGFKSWNLFEESIGFSGFEKLRILIDFSKLPEILKIQKNLERGAPHHDVAQLK